MLYRTGFKLLGMHLIKCALCLDAVQLDFMNI